MSNEAAKDDGSDPLLGTVLAGRYRVERLLGQGGMGRVYLAEHVLMRKAVALKVLHPEMTRIDEVVARFEREAVAAARIDHPSVATAMDFGRLEDGSLYFVLEYVDGRSLRSLLDVSPLGVDRALAIARQIASALDAAHDVGIVHRDLKPDNVMLVEQPDGTDRVKVLDFGIAKVTGWSDAAEPGRLLTRIGAVMGTAGYLPPEQAVGQEVNHLADLYAFGAMLYEMLTAQLPFHAEEITEILAKQLTEKPAPLPESVPEELRALVLKLLERAPSERVQSAHALVDELDRIRERLAVTTAPTAFLGDASQLVARTAPSSVSGSTISESREAQSTAARPRHGRALAWAALGAGGLVAIGGLVARGSNVPSAASPAASGTPSALPEPGRVAEAKAVASAAPPPD